MTTELIFYTTDGCHLCEEATVLLKQLLAKYPEQYQIELVDIVESDRLVELYGVRIPVIAKQGDIEGLGWPFDGAQLLTYVSST